MGLSVNGFVMLWKIVFSRSADSAVLDQRRARELGRGGLVGLHDREGRPADRNIVGAEWRTYHQGELRRYLDIEHQQASQCNDNRGCEPETRRGVHLHSLECCWRDELLRYLGCERYWHCMKWSVSLRLKNWVWDSACKHNVSRRNCSPILA